MIASLWIRQFPLQAYLRSHEESHDDILGMVESSDHTGASLILCVSKAAKDAGVRPGMTVAQGKLRAAELRIIGRNERDEGEASKALIEVISSYSPLVELGEEQELGWAYLDLAGLERLFGSFGELRSRLMMSLRGKKFEVLCGVARTRALARVLTFGGGGVFEKSEEALQRIGELPLLVLEPSVELSRIWLRFGLRSVRDFLALPLKSIADHMGAEALVLYRLANGEETGTGVLALQEQRDFSAEAYFEETLQSVQQVVSSLQELIASLMRQLIAAGYFCGDIELIFSYAGQGHHRCVIGVGEPTRNTNVLLDLCRLNLEAKSPEDAIGHVMVRARAVEVDPLQMSLFDTSERDGRAELGVTLAQLRSLCGDDKVGTPVLIDSYGEDTFELGKFGPGSKRAGNHFSSGLSMCLSRYRPPRPLKVRLANRRPVLMIGKGFGGRVVVCCGPFRANTEWWRSERGYLDSGSIRDIYDVQLSGGMRYRVAYCYPQNMWWALGWYD